MNASTGTLTGTPFRVGASGIPPWDRTGGAALSLAPRIGTFVAAGISPAARLLSANVDTIRTFITDGILREGRIVEAPFEAERTTFICVSACYPSRLFLEPGERLVSVSFGNPELWQADGKGRDVVGRVCVRVRARQEGSSDDMIVATDRRTYRIRLVGHGTKITIGCSWTYPGGGIVAATPAGEQGRWNGKRLGSVRPTRFIIFELGRTLREHVMDWADTATFEKTWQLRLYKTLRRRANVPAGDPHPPAFTTAVLKRLMAVGTISEPEIRQWLEAPGHGQGTVDHFRELATGLRLNRLTLPPGLQPSSEDMLDPFPFLTGLPETCYEDAESYGEVTGRARAIAWAMKGLAPAGALFCAVAPRYFRSDTLIERILRNVASLERIAAAGGLRFTLDEPANVDAVVDHLLDSPDCAHLSLGARSFMLWSLRILIRTLRRYIRFKDPENGRFLWAIRPEDFSRAAAGRLNHIQAEVGQEYRRSRKGRVLRFAGKLSALEFAADLNLEQIVLATKALASGAKDIGASDWIDVPVQMTIVDHRGRLQPGTQVCTWRIWRPLPYHRLLRSRTTDREERERLDAAIARLETAVDGPPPELLHEYRHTRGVAGSKPIEPFHVTCWRYGLMARPARLPARLRHKRHMLLQYWKLPGSGQQRSALLAGTDEQMDLWRISIRQHRTIAYLDAFEHALRFAHFGLSSVLENFSRATAWLQQTQDQSGWELRPLAGVKTAGFLAHDKQTGEPREEMTWFPVGPTHQREGMELAAMTCRRCGYADGLLPEVPHLRKAEHKRPDRQAWLFLYAGSVLGTAYLHLYLRFLLPWWGKITFHDFRHLGANAAFEDGVPGWIIRLTLNHGMTNMWEYYAEQSAAQNARFEEGFLRSRFERSATARSSSAVAHGRFG